MTRCSPLARRKTRPARPQKPWLGFENRFAKIEADLTMLKWMVGTSLVLMVGGFGLLARLIFETLPR